MKKLLRNRAPRCVCIMLLAASAVASEQSAHEPAEIVFARDLFPPRQHWSVADVFRLPPLLPPQEIQPALWIPSDAPLLASYRENEPGFPLSFREDAEKSPLSAKLGFNWGGALKQSGLLLGIQHSLRMLQEKTRNQLDGKWWEDYLTSIEGLQGWNDGNPIITNYVGHPMMGAITGYIQIQNDPKGILLEWAPHDGSYWKSRSKAMFWAALYSTQYELGPLGEAMIGNVGLKRGTMGYVDLVMTPIGGFGMILLEDWLDKRYVTNLERDKSERQARFLRVILNPQRSIANLLRFKRPSHRDTRELVVP